MATADQERRLTQITLDLFDWPVRLVTFLNKVGEIENRSHVSDSDKQRLKDIGRALSDLFSKVADLAEQQPTTEDLIQQLIASYDRMNEELAEATRLLDRIANKLC
jgi:hypothetical protein